jgi:hypothetical protein
MTKEEAVEKIVEKCKSFDDCEDCTLYVREVYTNCRLAMMVGSIPVRWKDKEAQDDGND